MHKRIVVVSLRSRCPRYLAPLPISREPSKLVWIAKEKERRDEFKDELVALFHSPKKIEADHQSPADGLDSNQRV